jgi:hypothetical protein
MGLEFGLILGGWGFVVTVVWALYELASEN